MTTNVGVIAKEILGKLGLSKNEYVLMFRNIILLFELASPDDNAYNIFDSKIQKYCKRTGLEIIPMNNVSEVNDFCSDEKVLQTKYPSGFIAFSHSGRNQLRQLIHHMRNACSHAGIRIVAEGVDEYVQFKAINRSKKIKLFARIKREQLEPFWNTVMETLKFS